jgi:hypothetical protein
MNVTSKSLEIYLLFYFGVKNGGSLSLWRKYFGPLAKIFGADIFLKCKKTTFMVIQDIFAVVVEKNKNSRNSLNTLDFGTKMLEGSRHNWPRKPNITRKSSTEIQGKCQDSE